MSVARSSRRCLSETPSARLTAVDLSLTTQARDVTKFIVSSRRSVVVIRVAGHLVWCLCKLCVLVCWCILCWMCVYKYTRSNWENHKVILLHLLQQSNFVCSQMLRFTLLSRDSSAERGSLDTCLNTVGLASRSTLSEDESTTSWCRRRNWSWC